MGYERSGEEEDSEEEGKEEVIGRRIVRGESQRKTEEGKRKRERERHWIYDFC